MKSAARSSHYDDFVVSDITVNVKNVRPIHIHIYIFIYLIWTIRWVPHRHDRRHIIYKLRTRSNFTRRPTETTRVLPGDDYCCSSCSGPKWRGRKVISWTPFVRVIIASSVNNFDARRGISLRIRFCPYVRTSYIYIYIYITYIYII